MLDCRRNEFREFPTNSLGVKMLMLVLVLVLVVMVLVVLALVAVVLVVVLGGLQHFFNVCLPPRARPANEKDSHNNLSWD